MSKEYADIEIRIRCKDKDTGVYPVEAELDNGAFEKGQLFLPRPEALLAAELDPQDYGFGLFKALFSGRIGDLFAQVCGRAARETEGRVRVRLRIDDDAAELHAQPWERLHYERQSEQLVALATSALTPFSRYISLRSPEPGLVEERPIRMLFAIANPIDLPPRFSPIDAAQEVQNLRQALGRIVQGNHIQVTLLLRCSGLPSDLLAQLETEGYDVQDQAVSLRKIVELIRGRHVFHFVGHGSFADNTNQGVGMAALHLEKEDGTWEPIKDSELEPKLAAIAPLPHLVFLAACESAKRGDQTKHPFVGLGPKLVRAGVPAVVAMQDRVAVTLTQQLTSDFYRGLLQHGVVDRALNEARLLLYGQDETDWAIPVLFMRLKEGRLFSATPEHLAPALSAADPMQTALQNICHWGEKGYLPIPMQVIHLVGLQNLGSLVRIEQESIPALDLVKTTFNIFSEAHSSAVSHQQGQLVILIGDHGMGRSVQLRHIARKTAEWSLGAHAGRPIVPVYVDLTDYPTVGAGRYDRLEALIVQSLQSFWPEFTAARLSELLRSSDGPILRVLMDNSDNLPDRSRHDAWRAIQTLVQYYPHHEYLLTTTPACYAPRRLRTATDLLLMQPLSERQVSRFLKELDEPSGRRLNSALARSQLFDLAASPWLLVRLLREAREGRLPHSRVEVQRDVVEDAIAEVPMDGGMRSRALQTLFSLAWEMQRMRRSRLAVNEALRIITAERGHFEYSAWALYEDLVRSGLIVQVGQTQMRFTYMTFQAYCCARAILEMDGRDQILDDITASLGKPLRLRWWEDTLAMLSGMMHNPNVLLRLIIHGFNLTEGEQVFLAVRCLLESDLQRIHRDLIDQVIDALVWRLDSVNEPRTGLRIRAVCALGQLRFLEVIPYLVRIANQKTRTDWRGKPAYEHGNVRMAAAVALQRMVPRALGEITAIDRRLAELLLLWEDSNEEALVEWLHSGDVDTQPIAAFALGDLQTRRAVNALIAAFRDPDVEPRMCWVLTDALAMLDPTEVRDRAVLPFLDPKAAERQGLTPEAWRRRAHRYEHLAYLIGKIRAQDSIVRDFLNRCLFEFRRVALKAKAIQSLGWLYDQSYKELFEKTACGDLSDIASDADYSLDDTLYLRRKAIEALADIGDHETLARLREGRAEWTPELERAFYRTSEEVSWRMSLGTDW